MTYNKIFCSNEKGLAILLISVNLLFVLIYSCDKAGNSSPGIPNLAGSWKIHETINGNCEGEDYPFNKIDIAAIKQNGNKLSVIYSTLGIDFSGTLAGNTITFSGNYPDNGGTNSIDFSGTLSADGNSFTGNASWTWSDNDYTCSGTAQVTGIKVAQALTNIDGEWEGIWESEDEYSTGSFTVDIIQSDTNLSGSINIPEIDIFDADLKGSFSGNSILFGDVNNEILFYGIVESDTSLTGGYTHDYLNDQGTWRAIKSGSD